MQTNPAILMRCGKSFIPDWSANRNLGEDIQEVKILGDERIKLKAQIAISADQNPAQTLARIWDQLSHFISPRVPFHKLNQCLAKGYSIDELFQGPRLSHGFILDEELSQEAKEETLHNSDLIAEIMKVSGVELVTELKSATAYSEWVEWSLDIDPARAQKFDPQKSEWTLLVDQQPVEVNLEKALQLYYRLKAAEVKHPLEASELDLMPSPGEDHQMSTYHLIKNQLPDTYGINEIGLSPAATPERKPRQINYWATY